jgi:hypothetical protein
MPEFQYPEIGTWNHLEAAIGARGMGKSTWQCHRALELQRRSGAYVIGHSLGARLPQRLPKELGGQELPVTYHTTITKLERGLRTRPERWHVLAPALSDKGEHTDLDTADGLLQFSVRLSTQIRKAAWNRAHPLRFWGPNVSYTGVHAPPVIVIVDEGIAVESAGPSRKDANRWFLEFLYSLRHMHIALMYAIQDGSARSWRILEQSTKIYVFAIRHQWALECMRAAGASDEEVERIRHLGKYQHVTLESLDSEPENAKRVQQLRDHM